MPHLICYLRGGDPATHNRAGASIAANPLAGLRDRASGGDILGLKWTDVDLDHGIITLFMQKTGDSIEIPTLPMVSELLSHMKRVAGKSAYIFTNPKTGEKG